MALLARVRCAPPGVPRPGPYDRRVSPWLHVLVPAYGPSPYLEAAVRSVLDAADDGVEVTVVDDGSEGPEVRDVAAAHERVEYLDLGENRGVAGAFGACVEHSRGTYTVIMGSDDLMEPWYVTELRALADQLDCPAMLMPAVTVVDETGRPARPLGDRVKGLLTPRTQIPVLLGGEALATRLLVGNWLYFPALAWRTETLRRHGFRADLATALDLDLELRLLFAGEQLGLGPRPSFRYRRHTRSASSVTASEGDRFHEEQMVFAAARAAAEARGWRRAAWAARLQPTSRLHHALAGARGTWAGRAARRSGG